ncbi:sigma-54-dependent Fis family transcriptional regulator [Neobacillus sedimentimangrovi]|uniref:Sigma-54-dependent Fis family transcriptional regulator n=1 Tax=Neobacillus sedimentimangrovi TaxID=2699460 RepID=A0ABS8QHV6_9BACI|nr:sigma-54-dependent Fis family transcriptional regulator [Neobacillus sedimentimangrovi]AIM15329.1 ATPase AAA [Bacillus sp. X1(2014)]MCD4838828.1 sigma-54-dependent Fis family transcriptional regulator [Neobacillus sedimentimangrovi]
MDPLTSLTREVLAAILKSIDEGIHVVNTEGKTIFYNEVAARHDGMEINEVLGKHLLEAFPSLTEESSTLLRVIKTAKPIYNQTQVYDNLHGRRIDTINTTLPILVDGEIIGAVEIAKDYSRMKLLSERLLDLQKGLNKGRKKKTTKKVKYTFDDLKTTSAAFKRMKDEAIKLSKSDSPILVYGESGTGKELFVQGIHYESLRSNGPFIAQNCAAIPETLLESILFGTAKGSYTGAVERKGLFELADGGTLFLDELHTMPIELQAKLLRVLEDGMIRRVGSSENITVDVRIIAAVNIHPNQALQEQRLRSDLYYRLNVFTFSLPPLRERKEDILFLVEFFIHDYNKRLNKKIKGLTKDLEVLFLEYHWPGNVRELKHTIEYMVNICEGDLLSTDDLPIMLKHLLDNNQKQRNKAETLSLRKNLEELEKRLISIAMERSQGNVKQAAELLEIPRQTLQYKLKKQKKVP